MNGTVTNLFKHRWLSAVRAAPSLSEADRKVAQWLADNLEGNSTTVFRTWWEMRSALNLNNHDAGVYIGMLTRAGLVGHRIRTGPNAGFPLELPLPKAKSPRSVASHEARSDIDARNTRRAAARRAADLRADARWLAK